MNFTTTDLHLAAFLVAKGFNITKFSADHRKGLFEFGDNNELRESIRAYFDKRGTVDALCYKHVLSDLKTMLNHA